MIFRKDSRTRVFGMKKKTPCAIYRQIEVSREVKHAKDFHILLHVRVLPKQSSLCKIYK